MIDFRYHLVSLISVFLALAIGIILGAGPLQGALGDQLTDQVGTLRAERNALRDELNQAEATATEQRRFIDAAGDQLVAGALTDKRVAVVDVDGAGDGVTGPLVEQLEAAGATIVAQEALTESWTAADEATMRDTVAGGLREGLADGLEEGTIGDETGTSAVLGAALTLALTDADPVDPALRSTEAADLQQQLERFGLVDVEMAPEAPADAILLVSGGETGAQGESPDDVDPAEWGVGSLVGLAGMAGDITGATVVAGPTTADGDLVSEVRADDDVVSVVSTVSGTEQLTGRVVVPLAVAAQLGGTVDQYGFEEGATVLPAKPEEQDAQSDDASADGQETTGDEQ
ncbi:copper transporter [Isoptericola sp. NEAU-Y5]|uniref:Copper transporter n=1 Tax=Isoptericola luteus TaxID=2879484 RepID=A0ABS7ZEH7_9MICO|nr:copper transporter [Isoptericola sp. NEAU-Y5]MCA5893430.1 copper transporter [Isoptericola sp. NEAU-Y5]